MILDYMMYRAALRITHVKLVSESLFSDVSDFGVMQPNKLWLVISGVTYTMQMNHIPKVNIAANDTV